MKKCLLALALAAGIPLAAAQSSWLYEQVSPQLYVRVPGQWQLLMADGARDPAPLLPHWQALRDKLAVLPGNMDGTLPDQKLLLDEWLAHNNGPLEIAFYLQGGSAQVLIGGQFTHGDDKRFAAFAQALARRLDADYQGDGKQGVLRHIGNKALQAAYRFDPQSGRHQWLLSDTLPENINWNSYLGDGDASLRAASAQMDSQGDGWLLWTRNNPMLLAAASGESDQWIKALQLLKLKSLSMGYGLAADGKPKWQGNAEITPGGLRDFFPTAPLPRDIAVYGTLQSVIAFTLPDAQGVQNILRIIEQGSGERQLYATMKNVWQRDLGIDVEVLFAGFGRQWMLIQDDFGQVAVMRKDDAWDKATAMLQSAGYVTIEETENNGIYHGKLSFAKLFSQDASAEELTRNPWFWLLFNTPNHFYYRDEGDYRFFAALPQPLLDRSRTKGGHTLGTLINGLDDTPVSLFALARMDQLARNHYYSRLSWLQYLADVADVSIDMTTFPSAQMLDLPEEGYLQAALIGDAENLRAQMVFEHGALDIFQQQGIYNSTVGVATMGVLAAIAIPAYQDYVERARQMQSEK